MEEKTSYIYVGKTKNGDPIKIPLAEIAVEGIKSLPSYGKDSYLFPAKPNVRFKSKEDFKNLTPVTWERDSGGSANRPE